MFISRSVGLALLRVHEDPTQRNSTPRLQGCDGLPQETSAWISLLQTNETYDGRTWRGWKNQVLLGIPRLDLIFFKYFTVAQYH